jgi:hypothetical protein
VTGWVIANDTLAALQTGLQMAASVAVIVVALAALRALRAQAAGNRVQMDLDLQVHDLGEEVVGELMVVLQNMGSRMQTVNNLLIEVRPSRHAAGSGAKLVPVTNLMADPDARLALPPGVRHAVTWTFLIPRQDRLLRATAAIGLGRRVDTHAVGALGQRVVAQLGPSGRYLTRVFDVTAVGFRRF